MIDWLGNFVEIFEGRIADLYFGARFDSLTGLRCVSNENGRGKNAGVAKLADARDLKSREGKISCRFESDHRHCSAKELSKINGMGFPQEKLRPATRFSHPLNFPLYKVNGALGNGRQKFLAVGFLHDAAV